MNTSDTPAFIQSERYGSKKKKAKAVKKKPVKKAKR
jgi:hypothetical protein